MLFNVFLILRKLINLVESMFIYFLNNNVEYIQSLFGSFLHLRIFFEFLKGVKSFKYDMPLNKIY